MASEFQIICQRRKTVSTGFNRSFKRLFVLRSIFSIGGFLFVKYPAFVGVRASANATQPRFASLTAAAPKLSPSFGAQIGALGDSDSVGTAVVTFNTTSGLQESHLNILR